jgi:hypothetical protein
MKGMQHLVHRAEQRLPDTGILGGLKHGAEGLEEGLHLLDLTRQAALHAAIQDPIDGLTQLVNHVSHSISGHDILPELHLIDAPPPAKFGSAEWVAETVGTGIGYVAPFMLTGGATSAIGGLARTSEILAVAERLPMAARVMGGVEIVAEELPMAAKLMKPAELIGEGSSLATRVAWKSVAKSTLDGGIMGFVLTPSRDPNKDFWTQRRDSAITSMVTFGTQGAVANAALGGLERAGLNTADAAMSSFLRTGLRFGSNALGGTAGGVVSAESNSLLNGRGFATTTELAQSVATFTVTGAALDAVHTIADPASNAINHVVGGTNHDAVRISEPIKSNVESSDSDPHQSTKTSDPGISNYAPPHAPDLDESTTQRPLSSKDSSETITATPAHPGETIDKTSKSSSIVEMTPERLAKFQDEAGDMTRMRDPEKIRSFVGKLNDLVKSQFQLDQLQIDRSLEKYKQLDAVSTTATEQAELVRDEIVSTAKQTRFLLKVNELESGSLQKLVEFVRKNESGFSTIPDLASKLLLIDQAVQASDAASEASKQLHLDLAKRVQPLQTFLDQFTTENGLPKIKLATRTSSGQGGNYMHGALNIAPLTLDGHNMPQLAEFLYHETTHSAQEFLIASAVADDIEGFDQLPRHQQQETLVMGLAKAFGKDADNIEWWERVRPGLVEQFAKNFKFDVNDPTQKNSLINKLLPTLPEWDYSADVIDARNGRRLTDVDKASAERLQKSYAELMRNKDGNSDIADASGFINQAQNLIDQLNGPDADKVARQVIDDLVQKGGGSIYYELFQVGNQGPNHVWRTRSGDAPGEGFRSFDTNSEFVDAHVFNRQLDPTEWHLEPGELAHGLLQSVKKQMSLIENSRKAKFAKYQETLHEMEAWSNGTLARQEYGP